jgi:hypothetical protein
MQGCAGLSQANPGKIDLSALKSPIVLEGDEHVAYRDPTCLYHDGIFRLYFTHIVGTGKGGFYWTVSCSESSDLVNWTEPRIITRRDQDLNFASPGNIIRFNDEWILCMQTYPTPNNERYGNKDCRVWITRSKDLVNWSEPEMLMVKGPDVPVNDVPVKDMGRLIDAYLVEDKDESGKWWCLFDDDAANVSYSYDLKTWTYVKRIEAGENVCVLIDNDEYLMFHSPKNGIGMKRSNDMINWRHVGKPVTKRDTGPITLGQKDWPWAMGRLTAGFVLDLRDDPRVGKYLLFFHGSGPDPEPVTFSTHCSLGIAWSDDLVTWNWPGKEQ